MDECEGGGGDLGPNKKLGVHGIELEIVNNALASQCITYNDAYECKLKNCPCFFNLIFLLMLLEWMVHVLL